MKFKPFNALRPAPGKAAQVCAVPYDVVNTDEARQLAANNEDSLLHVSRPEIDLPGVDIHADEVYAQGLKAFKSLQERGALIRDGEDCFYVYRQTMGDHAQTGVMGCCHVADYENNIILKHEKTRQDKEDDRTRHTLTLRANIGPVFLMYRDQPAIDAEVAAIMQTAPLENFVAADNVRHTVWRVNADAVPRLSAHMAGVPKAYIADGHHRAASAARAARELAAREDARPPCAMNGASSKNMEGERPREPHDEANWFLAVMFPASQLNILAYHRCVADLNNLPQADFLAAVGKIFDTREVADGVVLGQREARMYLAGRWYSLTWPEPQGNPVSKLDVSVLQDRLLAPVLGIDDPRTNSRISFVGGIRGAKELMRRVDSGEAAVAFAMFPVSVGEVMDIADADSIMPPKSTWFEPKLRSGVAIHTLD